MRTNLRAELTAALKARDRAAIAALRSALAAIENAEAVPVDAPPAGTSGNEHVAGASLGVGAAEAERRLLTEEQVREIVAAEVRERTEAAAEYQRLGQPETAARLQAEAAVLSRVLTSS